jgi:hypothetical protein
MIYSKWVEADGRFAFSLTDNGGQKLTEAARDELLADEADGKVLSPDAKGFPVALDPPDRATQLAEKERTWRDQVMVSLMGLRDRHRDQLQIEIDTTLTDEQFKELLVHMQALRDWPQSSDFPDTQYRPSLPLWLAEQLH